MSARIFHFSVDSEDIGVRLDTLVSIRTDTLSRSAAADLIRRGAITVDGEKKKAGYRVRPGDAVFGTVPEPEPVACRPEPIDFGVLYEDAHIIVVDKPPGLVVHPAPGHASGTLVNGLLFHCPDLGGIGGEIRPGIVHRLDKDTSGVLVVAKHDPALRSLSQQFKSRLVEKEYFALVGKSPDSDSGQIKLPIGRHPVDRKKMSTTSRRPRQADTAWTVIERFEGAALLRVRIMTGRTHQIRVHLAAVRLPIVGDTVYGSARTDAPRQMLHAHRIRFVHPISGDPFEVAAPIPADMARQIQWLSRPDN
jgi:23S rRNA pseudouridine1911/1915/1917 synthase